VETVQSYVNLGNAYREKKQYQEALNYFELALNIKITQLGPGHKDLSRYYKNMSDVYYLMGDNTRGDEFKEKTMNQ
jgi:tetratricopeptide (TPR) repeat protein